MDHGSEPSAKLMRMGARLLAAIFVGGTAGGLARAALEQSRPWDGRGWPWVTLAVNLAGTALLAYVITSLSHRPCARPLLGIGLCGALTTFSTLQLEAIQLADNGHAVLGATYACTSIAAGLLIARLVSSHPGSSRGGPQP